MLCRLNLDFTTFNLIFSFTEWTAQLKDFGELSYLSQLEWIKNLGNFYTSKVFQTKGVKDLMNSNEEFDLVLLEHFVNDAMTIFHHRFKCPLVFLVPVPPATLNNYLVGNEAPPSFVPNLLTDFNPKMTFWQRLQNTYLYYAGELFVHFRLLPDQNSLLKEHFPDAPDLSTILYNASMVLSLSHPSLSDPVPLQPNTKPIAGYHVSPTKPLPKDIKKFLDEAEDGVVLFSMGSNLKSANFEPKKRKAILQAFSKIKQKVLWKFETDLPEKPNNVMIMDWLPQADVLGRNNFFNTVSFLKSNLNNFSSSKRGSIHISRRTARDYRGSTSWSTNFWYTRLLGSNEKYRRCN